MKFTMPTLCLEPLNGTSCLNGPIRPWASCMSWCIALFGMTPFGWQFAGCMAGILMLPFMYLLAKQLTKRRDLALPLWRCWRWTACI